MKKITILNVTAIEPTLKPPIIFDRFDNLKSGESLILQNHQDPKPLNFQRVAQRDQIFTWNYLEQSPDFWNINITKN